MWLMALACHTSSWSLQLSSEESQGGVCFRRRIGRSRFDLEMTKAPGGAFVVCAFGTGRYLVANAAPYFGWINFFVRIQRLGLIQQHLGCFRVGRI